MEKFLKFQSVVDQARISIRRFQFNWTDVREAWKNVSGSITPLISGLFLILLVLSAGLVDVADAFLAKRELIQIVEPKAQRAVRSIDLFRYYNGNSVINNVILFSRNSLRVPINCVEAIAQARENLSGSLFRNNPIYIEEIECTNDELLITVNSEIRPIIDFSIFSQLLKSDKSRKGWIPINTTVGVTSIYQ